MVKEPEVINADILVKIEYYMTMIEDEVQDLRENVRRIIYPKKSTDKSSRVSTTYREEG